MSVHRATVTWRLKGDFASRQYSREHEIAFDGGAKVAGTASPSIVPAPWSRADAVDPEAAFTASLSACHMLWFLDHAVREGLVVQSYIDAAEGLLARDSSGKLAMTRVVLRPMIAFAGGAPDGETVARLHAAAHADCFIARSVLTEVLVESG